MTLSLVRPKVADLVFQVYARPLHPELFEILAERKVQHPDFDLSVRITRTGHIITWRAGDHMLTELADVDQGLANQRR